MSKIFICIGIMITILIPLCASTMTFDSKSDYFLLVFTVLALDGLCFLAHKEVNKSKKEDKKDEL